MENIVRKSRKGFLATYFGLTLGDALLGRTHVLVMYFRREKPLLCQDPPIVQGLDSKVFSFITTKQCENNLSISYVRIICKYHILI